MIGFLFSFVFAYFLLIGNHTLAILSFVGVLTDTLDGYVARNTGKVSVYGGFLDSTLDRASDFVIINAFAFAGLVNWRITLILTLLSFLISYTRSRAELAGGGKFKLDIGIMERTERLLAMVLFLIIYTAFLPEYLWRTYNILEIGFIFLSLISLITVIQRVKKAKELLKN